jgi:DNA-directed RNA polymerase specialized sigma24 family protein
MMIKYSKESQTAWHTRLCEGDVTAFSELCIVAIPYLADALRHHHSIKDSQLWHDIVIDTLIRYKDNPSKYNADESALLSYLYRDAEGDFLNFLKKENRRPAVIPLPAEDLEWLVAQDEEDEEDDLFATYRELDLEALFQRLGLNPRDEDLLRLMLNGRHDSAAYADILQITFLPIEEQRRTIKRHKDRLRQWLKTNGPKRL